jgi:hypothetical protein
MTHQRNLILSAAVAAAFGVTAISAHAGVASALPAKIATAALKNNSQGFQGNQLTYSTQVPLSNATIYYVYVKLVSGVFSAAPNAALFSSNSAVLSTALVGATATALSTDGTFVVYTLAATTGVVPVNTTISFTPSGTAAAAGGVSGLTALLAGGNVNEAISIGSSAQTSAVLADIDSAAGGNIITFTAPETYFATSSGVSQAVFTKLGIGGTAPETTTINVANGTGVNLTATAMTGASTTLIDFGGFVLTDVGGVLNAFQTNSWTIANEYSVGSLAATVTGNFAAAAALYLATDPACGTSVNSLTLNTAKTQATVATGTIIASGIGEVVCMLVDGKTSIPATTPAINITISTSAAAIEPGAPLSFGPSSLYALLPNGGTATVRAYIPAAATGYSDTVRIINIGQVASAITVSRIDPVTGAPGTPAVLPGTIAAGGATNYSNTTLETAMGGPFAATDRPRLLFTANTQIEAQNYIINPNGTLTTLHSKD